MVPSFMSGLSMQYSIMKGLLEIIREAASHHPMVNGVGTGDVFEISSATGLEYPLIWVDINGLSLDTNDIVSNFRLFYVDRTVDSGLDALDIQMDAARALRDVIRLLSQHYVIDTPIDATPFLQRFTDLCAGAFIDVKLTECPDTMGVTNAIVLPAQNLLPSHYVSYDGMTLREILDNGILSQVVTDDTITGNGTLGNPLSVESTITYLINLIRQVAPDVGISNVSVTWSDGLVVMITTEGGLEPLTTEWVLNGTILKVTAIDAVHQVAESEINLATEYPIVINSIVPTWVGNAWQFAVDATGGFGDCIVEYMQEGHMLEVTLTDQIGIIAETTLDLNLISPIGIDGFTSEVTGESEAVLTCIATGGFGSLTYSLYNGDGIVDTNETGAFTVTVEGNYYVVVTDDGGATPAVSSTIAVQFEVPIPEPDALFDTRTGVVASDSIGGLTAVFRDFVFFHWKSATSVISADNTYIAPDTGDITAITFVMPTQATVNLTDIKGFGGNGGNYIRISHLAKTALACINGAILTSASAFPDAANYLSNVYMLVWKYVQQEGKAYFRIYNTPTNFIEKTRTAALPPSGGVGLQFKQAALNANCGLILQLYYTSNLNDSTLSGIWNGNIPLANLTSLTSFANGEGIRTHAWDSVHGGQFQFQSGTGESVPLPYYNMRVSNIHAAYPLIYGFTRRALQDISYKPDGTKGIADMVGDYEHPSDVLWNMANGRLYFDTVTDAVIRAIMDKANRTYWKASIENEEHYIDAGGGYYGVWGATQLQRDFITEHAQEGHENHIFASLRTNGAVVTGITAIRIYKTNVV